MTTVAEVSTRLGRVAVLGATGSIGRQTLDLLTRLPGAEVAGLAVQRKVTELLTYVERFSPRAVAVADLDAARSLVQSRCTLFQGPDAAMDLLRAVAPDTVALAVSGMEALPLAVEALRSGARVAMATKEPLCVAGDLLRRSAGAPSRLTPIDSELTGLHLLLHCLPPRRVARLHLSASGGPFRQESLERLKQVSPAQALQHPRWAMGPKVTIDSATMINKVIELAAASRLYGLPPNKVAAYLHPQSQAHAAVELSDGSLVFVASHNDMRHSIAEALDLPAEATGFCKPLALIDTIFQFESFNQWQSRILDLAPIVATHRGAALALLAADEAGVQRFLAGRLNLADLLRRVIDAVSRAADQPDLDLDPDDFAAPVLTAYQRLLASFSTS